MVAKRFPIAGILLLVAAGVGLAQVPTALPPPSTVPTPIPQGFTTPTGPNFGNSGGGDPLAQGVVSYGDFLTSENLFVALGVKRDRIWANSTKHGAWQRQVLPNGALGPIVPMLSPNIVCFQAGKQIYAFSAYTGGWSSTTIEVALPVEMQLAEDVLWFRQDSRIYTYCAKPGNWSTVDIARD
ncbi:MAG: hypothetical protein C0483_07085 [Pirellula sp.]|nr:hypothetical protein [Pirellula sp.]